jgi:hypothetical protein
MVCSIGWRRTTELCSSSGAWSDEHRRDCRYPGDVGIHGEAIAGARFGPFVPLDGRRATLGRRGEMGTMRTIMSEPKDSAALTQATDLCRDTLGPPTTAELDRGLDSFLARISPNKVRPRRFVRWSLAGVAVAMCTLVALQVTSVFESAGLLVREQRLPTGSMVAVFSKAAICANPVTRA